jgi:hypothetical protein
MMAFVESPYFQDKYIKPFTLYPSAGTDNGYDRFPMPNESHEEFIKRMEKLAPIRRRAKEIYEEIKTF